MNNDWNTSDLGKHLQKKFSGWHFIVSKSPFFVRFIEDTDDYSLINSVKKEVDKWFKDELGVDNYIEWHEIYWDTYFVK